MPVQANRWAQCTVAVAGCLPGVAADEHVGLLVERPVVGVGCFLKNLWIDNPESP